MRFERRRLHLSSPVQIITVSIYFEQLGGGKIFGAFLFYFNNVLKDCQHRRPMIFRQAGPLTVAGATVP
jgi:hypothetical protein